VYPAVKLEVALFWTALAGRRDAFSVPEEMFEAFVVSVVALAANALPLVLVTVRAPVDVFNVPSPETVNPPKAPELLNCSCPEEPPGEPPAPPDGVAQVPSPRQYVEELAPVPPFRRAVERLPVKSAALPDVATVAKVGLLERSA
jgi:hypothetical protein